MFSFFNPCLLIGIISPCWHILSHNKSKCLGLILTFVPRNTKFNWYWIWKRAASIPKIEYISFGSELDVLDVSILLRHKISNKLLPVALKKYSFLAIKLPFSFVMICDIAFSSCGIHTFVIPSTPLITTFLISFILDSIYIISSFARLIFVWKLILKRNTNLDELSSININDAVG